MEIPEFKHTGIPLASVGLDGLTVVYVDGRKEPLTGFVQYRDETMFDALTRTATEMNATIIYHPEVKSQCP
jgi:hypothetical protein